MLSFFKKEPVLSIASLAALISCFFVFPSKAYIGYLDFHVLILLFCLMIVVAGLMKTRLFDMISAKILSSSDNSRTIALLLTNITFLSAMLITNDVALITMVPFSAGIFKKCRKDMLIKLVVLETVAANLGSMITPFGNPQNLYLYSHFNMKMSDFASATLPFGLLSLLMINISVFLLIKKEKIVCEETDEVKIEGKRDLCIFGILFILCVLTVFKVVNALICIAVVFLVCLIIDRKLFFKVDYFLLLTFCAFFIFVGNMKNIETISAFISEFTQGREFMAGVLSSQIISNVPAAMMLSGFTDNAADLMMGTDIGGLGTLVASLASLISYKQYSKTENADMKKYLFTFTIVNVIFLVILAGIYILLR